MKMIIVNGIPDESNSPFENYLAEYQMKLSAMGHKAKIITLREMNLGFCRGCFNCWHTTPGICSIGDDIKFIHRDVINADLIVWASPLFNGYITGLLKKVQERMIPLLHPYVELVSGEIHHRKRYGQYPDHGVIVETKSDTDSEELLIVQKLQERYALNFRSKLNFFLTSETSVSNAVYDTVRSTTPAIMHINDYESATEPAFTLFTSSLN